MIVFMVNVYQYVLYIYLFVSLYMYIYITIKYPHYTWIIHIISMYVASVKTGNFRITYVIFRC